MNLIDLALDGGLAVQLLLLPAIAGTLVLGLVRLATRAPRRGVFEASLAIVLGAAAASVALGLMRAMDAVAGQGTSGPMVIGMFRLVGGTLLLALIGAALLAALELVATLRRRNSPVVAPARGLRPLILTGWVAGAVAIGSVVAFLLRIAATLDAVTLAPLAMPDPAGEFASLTRLTRMGLAGGSLAIVAGLAGLWHAFDGFRSRVVTGGAIGNGDDPAEAEGVHG